LGPQPGEQEHPPFFDPLRAIQLQQTDGRPAGGCVASERPIGGEIEMGRPGVLSGIEQRHDVAGLGIDRRQVTALVPVAKGAAEGEIVRVGRAIVLFSDDMINVVRGKTERLWDCAVFTAPGGPLMDQPAQANGDKGAAHACRSRCAARILDLRTKCSMY